MEEFKNLVCSDCKHQFKSNIQTKKPRCSACGSYSVVEMDGDIPAIDILDELKNDIVKEMEEINDSIGEELLSDLSENLDQLKEAIIKDVHRTSDTDRKIQNYEIENMVKQVYGELVAEIKGLHDESGKRSDMKLDSLANRISELEEKNDLLIAKHEEVIDVVSRKLDALNGNIEKIVRDGGFTR
ncbi:hypothetical protein [Methanohalophilus halophilus]|uniref:Uncharacterized protein n=2 Tax=Methanohalophilus halophilus TaxID=2177 RepID=A0A1L3Q3Y7_9EURY|nr:hypothetical protein [Methanohalophilus halophilus]APH39491.1 hypothetical protein BHR79_08370 [Methanohalophilus halophilus]SDW27997.1 hypothetical protein SAMN04515625_0582 [Methanohalophilus halophilus]